MGKIAFTITVIKTGLTELELKKQPVSLLLLTILLDKTKGQ